MELTKLIQIQPNQIYKVRYPTGKIKEIQYKVNITKIEKPLSELKEIDDKCDEFFNMLLDSNIFELREHYKQWLLVGNQSNDNKFIELREFIDNFYKSKSKIHYNIIIEIVKVIAYDNLTIHEKSFKYQNDIINRIFSFKFRKNYRKSSNIIYEDERIREVIDDIIFRIGDNEYYYDFVEDSDFMNENLVEYIVSGNNYTIHVNKDDLNKNIIYNLGYCKFRNNYIYFSLITLDGKKYIVFNDDSYIVKRKYKLPQIKLNVHNYGQRQILKKIYSHETTWKYDYVYDVDLYVIDDNKLLEALKNKIKEVYSEVEIKDINYIDIMVPVFGEEHRIERYNDRIDY